MAQHSDRADDMMIGNPETDAYYGEQLLAWYERQRRDLPWRRSRDPYRIWVSEIMLQQTRVDTVIPYYHRFLEKFPTVEALADAPEEEVLKAWEGLGYYSRARNLQAAVREVKSKYGGRVPDDRDSVFALKGVGPYTAGAILSIAFNRPEPAVDGNVMRVLSRFFLLEDDIAKPATRTGIERLARRLIPEGRAGDFNQALMELGATVCTPRAPMCMVCPVMERCEARLAGREEELPIKRKAKPPRPEERVALWVLGTGEHDGKLLIRRRPDDGLLARMWELPHALLPPAVGAGGELPLDVLADLAGAALPDSAAGRIEPFGRGMEATHVFSHIRWRMQVLRCRLDADAAAGLPPEYRWITLGERDGYAFPNVFLRIMAQEGESMRA